MENIKQVLNFLKDAKTFYLATVEDDQPRVRPSESMSSKT